MTAWITSASADVATLVGIVAGTAWLTLHLNHRFQRRRHLLRGAEPCRRCGARN